MNIIDMVKDDDVRQLAHKSDILAGHEIWKADQTGLGAVRPGELIEAVVKAPNIHLYTYANVTGIDANENASSIRQVTVKNLAGKQHTVRAKKICAGLLRYSKCKIAACIQCTIAKRIG